MKPGGKGELMFHVIENLLNKNELAAVLAEAEKLEFSAGELTAGNAAKKVKNNLQAPDFVKTDAYKLVMRKLARHNEFQAVALPARISGLMISKYQRDMAYGWHIDNPLIDGGHIRSDIAMTLFLSAPESYNGGELEIRIGSGADNLMRYKLTAGSIILYPAHHLHNVAEILAGTRLAIIGWVQSLVRDPAKRKILYDLSVVRQNLHEKDAASPDLLNLECATCNLIRMWAEN
jgi:PKHD-type hydroxylase